MKGDFTRFTHDPRKHYTRVLKQQGRVDLDADWNEVVEIFTYRDRTEAIDVIGRCGAPMDGGGFKIEASPDGSDLTISPGRLYVDGILCEHEGEDPTPITAQEDLPDYALPEEDGVYLAYVDVWDRHITYLEDPEIREVALGGPDTTTRTKTVAQVRLHRLGDDAPLDQYECEPYPADPSAGRMAAGAAAAGAPTNPCAVPEGAGYTGLENRLYRVEIHDDGRDEDGNPGARPVTFKWSRDNGSVVLPIVDENGIDGDTVTLRRLGHDEVLTVRVGDMVEILGDTTELYGRPGTLAQIVPDGVNKNLLRVELDQDVSSHADEAHLKMRRWDHHETDDLELINGALPLPDGPFELEDGVIIEFEDGGTYHVGDYWVIPARTREGTVLWPQEGGASSLLLPFGIHHHYCTLALVRRSGGTWTEPHDCRPLFPPLTEVDGGCCCRSVDPGQDIQQAIDSVVAAGGGCVSLCEGEHVVTGTLRLDAAADVTLHGTGSASVIRFVSGEADEAGFILRNVRRIEIRDLMIVSNDARSLIDIRHDSDFVPNREIAFRRLTLVNYGRSDGETSFAAAIRVGHASDVTIDECRLAAEAGVLATWGNDLPDPGSTSEGTPAPALLTLDFDDLDVGSEYRVGDRFTTSDTEVRCEAFQDMNGEMRDDGFAAVEDGGRAGGSGGELQLSNITLNFQLPATYAAARIRFGDYGGTANLRINGDMRAVERLIALHDQEVGGVRVRVDMGPNGSELGMLSLDAQAQDIGDLALGGQELWIDDVVFRGPGETVPGEPVMRYGDGVARLRMRDTTMRYLEVGVLAARAEDWQLDRCDIRPLDIQAWSSHLSAIGGSADLLALRAAHHLPAVDPLADIWAAGEADTGAALLAFRWHNCSVRDSRLSGGLGSVAFWWLRGSATGNVITAGDAALRALWLYETSLAHNTVEAPGGAAVTFAGSCRLKLEHSRIRGAVGMANLSMSSGMKDLHLMAEALLRAYGSTSQLARAMLHGMLVDESLRVMGFGSLLDTLQPAVDEESETPGIPAAYYVASPLLQAFSDGAFSNTRLAVVDLDVTHNDIECGQRGIFLEGFLPLGSLRIADNRIHTTTGQAVRVQVNRFAANAHLVVFLFRSLLVLLGRRLDEAMENPENEMGAAVMKALADLLSRWQIGAERLFNLDFRIEGNTIRSLRTAIDSNLFELSILTNHITMQERALRRTQENAAVIFGHVMTAAGAPLAGASVRIVSTERSVSTDVSGAFRFTGLAAGTYILRATGAGFTATTQQITLRATEQAEVDIIVDRIGRMTHLREPLGASDVVISEGQISGAANVEIQNVMQALERSTALEPLGVSLREGAMVSPDAYASYLASDAGPLASAEERRSAAEAASLVQGHASDPEMRQVAEQLSTALRANDRTQFHPLLVRFIRALQRYVDSQGILVRGVGGRIIGNQIIVPADAQPDTEALGGLQISVNFADLFLLLAMGRILIDYLSTENEKQREQTPLDPLLGVTETLIDTNEIIGGIGHGISIQGMAGQPDFVSDLRIRGNQIRGMAGSGIFINEHALVVGLDVSGTHISACGRPAGFTRRKGGIVIQTAAACSLAGNRILRCGDALADLGAYGIDIDAVYGLQVVGNDVQANGSAGATSDDGGLRLVEVYGDTLVHDNVISFNRGLGLSWVNSAREGEDALLPPILMQAVNLYLRMNRSVAELVAEEQASIQGNAFKTVFASDFPIFQLLNLRQVLFSGNTCHAETTGAPLGEIQQTARGVVSNNQTQTSGDIAIAIKKMAAGAVVGNVGNRPIQLQASAAVERAFNVPAAI